MFTPKEVDDFIGEQRQLAKSLFEISKSNTPFQTILFTGSSGIGKTSLARFYAENLPGTKQITHINCVDKSGIGDVRELIPLIETPSFYNWKVFFFDELHGWSGKAQEGLLIVLEKLPTNVIILAASTQPEKIDETLKSRFQATFKLSTPSRREMAKLVIKLFGENDVPKEVGKQILDQGGGNIRQIVHLTETYLKTGYLPFQIESKDRNFLSLFLSNKKEEILNHISKYSVSYQDILTISYWAKRNLLDKRAQTFLNVLFSMENQLRLPEDIFYAGVFVSYFEQIEQFNHER